MMHDTMPCGMLTILAVGMGDIGPPLMINCIYITDKSNCPQTL